MACTFADALAGLRRIAERLEVEIQQLEAANKPDRQQIARLSIKQSAIRDAITELHAAKPAA